MRPDASLMTPGELERELQKLAHKTNDLCDTLHPLRSTYKTLDTHKTRMLAVITDRQKGNSHAEKERKALVSVEWKKYLRALCLARKKFEKADYEADNSNRLYESCRSVLSSKNTQRRTVT